MVTPPLAGRVRRQRVAGDRTAATLKAGLRRHSGVQAVFRDGSYAYAETIPQPGSKLRILTEVSGLPLAVAVSGANTNDMNAVKPLVHAVPGVRLRRSPRCRRPAKLRADKGYDYVHLGRWLRARSIVLRIARVGVEPHARLGRYRVRVERTVAWLFTCRRLGVR